MPQEIGWLQVALKVAMACGGCEGAVRRVLQNKPGMPPTVSKAVRTVNRLSHAMPGITPAPLMSFGGHLHFLLLRAHGARYRAGVQSVDIDLAQQKVLVKGDVSQDDILQTVSKTGKKTELWQ